MRNVTDEVAGVARADLGAKPASISTGWRTVSQVGIGVSCVCATRMRVVQESIAGGSCGSVNKAHGGRRKIKQCEIISSNMVSRKNFGCGTDNSSEQSLHNTCTPL